MPEMSRSASARVYSPERMADERFGSRPDLLAEIALERADRAMIAAKSLGRNRVLMAPMQPVH